VTTEHREVQSRDHRELTTTVVRAKVASARLVQLEIVRTEMLRHSESAQSGHLAPEPEVQPVRVVPPRQVMVVLPVREEVVPVGWRAVAALVDVPSLDQSLEVGVQRVARP
jgi:hypothetical protein